MLPISAQENSLAPFYLQAALILAAAAEVDMMRLGSFVLAVALAAAAIVLFWPAGPAYGGEQVIAPAYTVLPPISHDNLTVFPVVASSARGGNLFLTLDEGLASGQVTVGEAGAVRPLVRGPHPHPVPQSYGDVNRLVLINNSDRPLLLLAGEIVTGGKQDRVIAADRIVAPHSDPVDLGVFCVDPGRWTGQAKFGSTAVQMAQPTVRKQAMAAKDQQRVWDSVRSAQESVAVAAGAPAAATGTTSYARVMQNEAVQSKVDSVAAPVQRSYEGLPRELRARNAVGVVVSVNGRIVWADIFSGPELLEKYWPKLVRSYATEALTSGAWIAKPPSRAAAQSFINNLSGSHQEIEIEPGLYRHTEITGPGFRAFTLSSLLPKTGYDVHISKMAE